MTKNNEKCILVAYVNVYTLDKEDAIRLFNEFANALDKSFNSIEIDDTMAFICLPSDHNDIKLLNPADSFLTEEDINKFKKAFNNFIESNK